MRPLELSKDGPTTRLIPRGPSRPADRIGLPRSGFSDIYHYILTTSWPRFFGLVVSLYAVINTLFAVGYMLDRGGIENAREGSFTDAFFFSVQTMATIGYGKMAPRSLCSHLLVTVEALLGMLCIALSTSLLFAKFSRPTARVLFSSQAIVMTRDGVPCLMFRMANARKNQIVEAQLRVIFARAEVTEEGEKLRRFHDMKMQRDQTAIFALTWTAVHPIDERSPLHDQTPASLLTTDVEIIVSLTGIDETFSQTVHARHSYLPSEIVWGGRFVDIIGRGPDGNRTLDYTRFHDVIEPPPPREVTALGGEVPQTAGAVPR